MELNLRRAVIVRVLHWLAIEPICPLRGSAVNAASFVSVLLGSMAVLPGFGQSGAALPPALLGAKTVIVLNETHTSTVEDGAEEELKQWGRLKLTDDLDAADLVVNFSKKTRHETSNTQKTDENGKPSEYSFNITSDSTIYMTVTAKNGVAPVYSTESKDGKQKAGRECVQAFIAAWQAARQKQSGAH